MPPKGERRKQQIIDAAKDMFMEKGFQSTHIGQVCERLDIARGTVYQYFSNKKEILYSLVDSVIDNVRDVLDQDDLREYLNSRPDKDSVITYITRRISSSIEMMLGEPIVIKLLFKDIVGIDQDVVEHVNRSIETIKSLIAEEIAELRDRGVFREDVHPSITSGMLVGGIMLIVYEYDKAGLDVLKPEVIDAIAKNYLNGVFRR
jgi:AcrR family transcriptional regulator